MYFDIFSISYSISSLACFITDYFFPEKRVNSVTKEKVLKDYKAMIPLVSFNLALSYPIFEYSEKYIENNSNHINYFLYFIYWLIFADLIFFTSHYLHHKPKFYQYIHSIHHRYRYTYGMGAIYAHPLDHLSINLFSTFLPIIVYPPNREMAIFIIIFSSSYTVIISHGCYKIFSKSHLRHHLRYKTDFGLFLTDKIFI